MRVLIALGIMVGIVAFGHSFDHGGPSEGGLFGFLACVYLFPTFVAFMRGHPGTLMVFVINLFLGWTFLGWVSALVQACVPIYKSIPISVTDHRNPGGFAG